MRTVQFGNRMVELAGGALTPLAWHRAFGDDNFFDAITRIDKYLMAANSQAAKAKQDGSDSEYINGFPDYDVLRCAYVLAWTADYAACRTPVSFEIWANEVGEVNMYQLAWEVSAELTSGLFRQKR